jgi:autophagy-related protein 9
MDNSIFIHNRDKPLLDEYDEYELLSDDIDGSQSNRDQQQQPSTPLMDSVQNLLPQIRTANGFHSPECILDDIYRYYWVRGLWKYIATDIGHLVLLTWLVMFCIFLGTCVDYTGIIAAHPNGSESIWKYIQMSKMSQMSWYFIVALVIFSIYATWRLIKFARDVRRLGRVSKFFHQTLGITDFDLRTARWANILVKLKNVPEHTFAILQPAPDSMTRLHNVCQSQPTIASLVTKKENFFKKLLELGHFDFVFHLKFPRQTSAYEIMMLTRGLQWNIMYCVVNFFFDNELQVKQAFVDPSRAQTQLLTDQLKRRILVIGILNILLLPFLVVFVALYAVFRYGEQFYKNPGSVGTRQWSLAARWYFRDYDELTHVFEERMRIAGRYAKQYTSQFAPTAIEGIARSVAFVIGSIVVWLLLLSFLNDRALLGLELSPSKTLLWWITVLSSVWVICRGMLQDQHVFYPGDALQVVYSLTRRLPIHFVDNPGAQRTLKQFNQLFPLQILLLIQEFVGLLVTPWILLRRIYPKAENIIDSVKLHMQHTPEKHYFFGLDLEHGVAESVADFKEHEVLRSEQLVPFLQRLDTVTANDA